MVDIDFTHLRQEITEVANYVKYGEKRYVVTKNGIPFMAIVPIQDLELIENVKKSEERSTMDIPSEKKSVSILEAAEILKVPHTYLRKRISQGLLKAPLIGRSRRIAVEELNRFRKSESRLNDNLLTRQDAAQLLGISNHAINQLIKMKKIQLAQYGGRGYRISRNEIDRFTKEEIL